MNQPGPGRGLVFPDDIGPSSRKQVLQDEQTPGTTPNDQILDEEVKHCYTTSPVGGSSMSATLNSGNSTTTNYVFNVFSGGELTADLSSIFPSGSRVEGVESEINEEDDTPPPGSPLKIPLPTSPMRAQNYPPTCFTATGRNSMRQESESGPSNHRRRETSTSSRVYSESLSSSRLKLQLPHIEVMKRSDLRLPKDGDEDIRIYTIAMSKCLLASPFAICLWDPHPNQNLDMDLHEKHCTLGDVGTFSSDGRFKVMFNIFMSREDNDKMNYRPPLGFEPLKADRFEDARPRDRRNAFHSPNFVRKPGETGNSTYSYKSTSRPDDLGGAILVMPNGFTKVTIEHNLILEIKRYIADQVELWYDGAVDYSNTRQHVSDGSLKLVFTCFKSQIWAAAVLPKNRYDPNDANAKLERFPDSTDMYAWDASPSIRVNDGSSREDNVDKIYRTVAVEVFSVFRGPKPKNFLSHFTLDKAPMSSRESLHSKVTKSVTGSFTRLMRPSSSLLQTLKR